MKQRPDLDRWLPLPDGVRLRDPAPLPAGFRAGGVSAGSKPSGALDLGVIHCTEPAMASAARFTPSATAAAPVVITRDRLRQPIACGPCSSTAATRTRRRARWASRRPPACRAPAPSCSASRSSTSASARPARSASRSTAGCSCRTLPRLGDELSTDATTFNQAICTTDLFLKRAAVELDLAGGTVRITAQAKGAGMIHPGFATMLAFVQTDAQLSAGQCGRLLDHALAQTFQPRLGRRPALHQRHGRAAGQRRLGDRARRRRRGRADPGGARSRDARPRPPAHRGWRGCPRGSRG